MLGVSAAEAVRYARYVASGDDRPPSMATVNKTDGPFMHYRGSHREAGRKLPSSSMASVMRHRRPFRHHRGSRHEAIEKLVGSCLVKYGFGNETSTAI